MFSSLYAFIAGRSHADKQLLTRIRQGSESAYRTFYDMNVRSTNYMAYGFTNQKLGAEDLGFETLKEIWRNHTSIDVNKPTKVLIAETMIAIYIRNTRMQNN